MIPFGLVAPAIRFLSLRLLAFWCLVVGFPYLADEKLFALSGGSKGSPGGEGWGGVLGGWGGWAFHCLFFWKWDQLLATPGHPCLG